MLRMPSHFVPSRPREAEAGVLRKLGLEIAGKTNPLKSYCIAPGVVCLPSLREQIARKHEPGHHARGCCFGESRRTEIFPAEPEVPCRYVSRWRIRSQMLPGDAA